ncbi:hypothetical protein V2J09_004462 [Rumex salicifolius]
MELSVAVTHRPSLLNSTLFFSSRKRFSNTKSHILRCLCSISYSTAKPEEDTFTLCSNQGRRELIACLLLTAAGLCVSDDAIAVSTSRRALRASKIPDGEFKSLPNGLKYYDLKVGGGTEAVKGSRVAVQGQDELWRSQAAQNASGKDINHRPESGFARLEDRLVRVIQLMELNPNEGMSMPMPRGDANSKGSLMEIEPPGFRRVHLEQTRTKVETTPLMMKKVEFLNFDCEDVLSWVSKVDQYIAIQSTKHVD